MMTFSKALDLLKQGKRLCREGWNGQGIFIELQVPDENSKMTVPYLFIDTFSLGTTNQKAFMQGCHGVHHKLIYCRMIGNG